MTRVSFYSNVDDKLALVSHLVEKALHQRRQVTIFTAKEEAALQVSDTLWSNNKSSYLNNVLADDVLASVTPVIVDWQVSTIFQDDLLINLQDQQPTFFSRFRHLVEIVGQEVQDKVLARKRYSFYRDCGYEIKHIDMLKKQYNS